MIRKGRRPRILLLFLAALLVAWLFIPGASPGSEAPRYIFILFADGIGLSHVELARQYNRLVLSEGLTITDRIFREGSLAIQTTHSASSLVTDSAAAGTALFTGVKTNNGMVSVTPDGKPLRTVAEAAKAKGMRVALITTDEVYDASPAAMGSHAGSRRDIARIIDGYLANDIDLLLGGGRGGFLPKLARGSARKDERDLIAEFKAKGYAYVSTLEELRKADTPRLLGLFHEKAMPFDLDRDPASDPSVFDMMEAALRILQKHSPRGFLLFLESENTDEANHDSDAASLLAALREMDRAAALAYEFYSLHPKETLILFLSDHETGGLSPTYAQADLTSKNRKDRIYPGAAQLSPIRNISCSAKRAGQLMGKSPGNVDIDRVLARCYPGFEMPERYRQWIIKDELPGPNYFHLRENALGLTVALKTQIYYGTEGHTAQPTFAVALGAGAERFKGYMDNTEIGKALLDLLK